MALATIAATVLSPSYQAQAAEPKNFLFLDADDISDYRAMLTRRDIAGGQIIYSWNQLEPEKDKYDFLKIERDLAIVKILHKKLWVSIDDLNFSLEWKNIPNYLSQDPIYGGGVVYQHSYVGKRTEANKVPNGYVAMQ